MATKHKPFDPTKYLATPEAQQVFLAEAVKSEDAEHINNALSILASIGAPRQNITEHLIDAGWLPPDDADALRDENAHLRQLKDDAIRLAADHAGRVGFLEGAIKAFLAKYKLCEPYLVDAFTFQTAHGLEYDGPNWSEELASLTAIVMSESESESEN